MKRITLSFLPFLSLFYVVATLPTAINLDNSVISPQLFESLEELARIVDISYCVGSTGIQKPFECAGRCHDFEGFELIDQWKTGILMSDSCGYIALSHPPFPKRVIVAFRGTYSIANTVVDLSTTPAEYLPYPSEDDENACVTVNNVANFQEQFADPANPASSQSSSAEDDEPCANCTIHAGFLTSWKNTRCILLPLIESALAQYPDYQLTLVGHSLGGAVASLASLEFLARGWEPQVTTFGEPRIGNQALVDYIDRKFQMNKQEAKERTYRRVTHAHDPVPLLPLEEWGYKMHAGEIYISKPSLPPARSDIHHCLGDEDGKCIAGTEKYKSHASGEEEDVTLDVHEILRAASGDQAVLNKIAATTNDWHVPDRYRLWELFFAHRDYFWRLGLCVPGGDPKDWWRPPYTSGNDTEPQVEHSKNTGVAILEEEGVKADL